MDKQIALCKCVSDFVCVELTPEFIILRGQQQQTNNAINDIIELLATLGKRIEGLKPPPTGKSKEKLVDCKSAVIPAKSITTPPIKTPRDNIHREGVLNAMLFFIDNLVNDIDGCRSEIVSEFPDATAIRDYTVFMKKGKDVDTMQNIANKWPDGEVLPADWRLLGRVAWKRLAETRKDQIRSSFKGSQKNSC